MGKTRSAHPNYAALLNYVVFKVKIS